MSKLSELLNPLPGPNASRINPPLNDDAHSMKKPESLAGAATSTAPLLSPTKPLAPFISSVVAPYQSHQSQSTGNRLSPPPTLEHSHQPEHSVAFSTGLEQYHHSTSPEAKTTSRKSSPVNRSLNDESDKMEMRGSNGGSEDNAHSKASTPGVQEMNSKHNSNNCDEIERSVSRQESVPDQTFPIAHTHPAEVEVKAEITDNPPEVLQGDINHRELGDLSARASSQPTDIAMEMAPSRMITELKNDMNTQPSMKDSQASTRSPSATPKTQTPRSRKRPAPKSKAEKKGTASTVNRATKRRKIDDDSIDGTRSVQRSETPTSSRASKTPGSKNRKQQSVTPLRSSSPFDPDEDDQYEDDDLTLFCICRKPDDHNWMIACDGKCQDWFHGKCVGIDETDGKLIDKYFCAFTFTPSILTYFCAPSYPRICHISHTFVRPIFLYAAHSHLNCVRLIICSTILTLIFQQPLTFGMPGPNCKENGVGQTTWKPMCRLITCRNPARVSRPEPSKYCSDAHGAEYMRIHAMKQESEEANSIASSSNQNKKRRRDNNTDHFGNGDDNIELADDLNTLRGGVLRAPELKSLADGVKNIAEFRQLGEGVLSPPRIASPEHNGDNSVKTKGRPRNPKSPHKSRNSISYSPSELQQLSDIATKREKLEARKLMLEDRDRFLGFVKSRAKRVLENLRKTETVKDICGFDARLSWSDEEFLAWRDSPEGQTALKSGTLMAPANITVDGTSHPEATTDIENCGADEDEHGRGVCQKRRCERHRAWWKLQQQDILFEKGEVRSALGRLGGEEEGVRKRAVVRRLEEG